VLRPRFGYSIIAYKEYVAWAVKDRPDTFKSAGLRNLSLDDIKQRFWLNFCIIREIRNGAAY